MNCTNSTTSSVTFASTPDFSVITPHSAEVVLLISILAGICSLLTVVGNLVVIMSFFVNKSLRNFSNYMILSLALSDLTIGAFSMNVFTTYNVHQKWILGEAMCKAWLSVDYTASNASVMNLLVICVDRYLAIIKPVKYRRWCTPEHAIIAIVFVWVISFLMWVPAITLWDVSSPNTTLPEGVCYIPFIYDSPTLSVATIITAFYFPAFLMCLLYFRVIHQIKKRRQSGIRSLIRSAAPKPLFGPGTIYQKGKRTFSPPSDENAKASPSGSNPMSLHNPENVPLHRTTSQNKKSMRLELSDLSTTSTPSVRSRLSNTDLMKVDEVDRLDATGHKPKSLFLQRSASKSESHRPSFLKRSASNEPKAKLENSDFVSLDQNKQLLTCKQRRSGESIRYNREHRVTVLLKFILLCFIILWLPYSMTVIVEALCDGCVPAVVWNLGYWLCYLNSTVNPFCYGLCNSNFRRTFKAILTTKWWTKESRKNLRTGRKRLISCNTKYPLNRNNSSLKYSFSCQPK